MASSNLGLFIPSHDKIIKQSIENMFDNKGHLVTFESPFKGIVLYDIFLKYEDPDNFDEFKNDNIELLNKVIDLSFTYREVPFILMEEYIHGDLSSFQGVVYLNGTLTVNEMGNFDTIFQENIKVFESNKTDWYTFYDNRLDRLTSSLKLSDKNIDLFDYYEQKP